MNFKGELNLKFYIVSLILAVFTAIGWYGVYFLNVNEILMEDNTPMTAETKILFTVLLCIILLSWSISLITLIRQAVLNFAFSIDESGIHNTASAIMIFAFIFVIPVKNIPYSAIKKISYEEGILTLTLDKSQIDVLPLLRPFVSKRYRLFSGFTCQKQLEIEENLKRIGKLEF